MVTVQKEQNKKVVQFHVPPKQHRPGHRIRKFCGDMYGFFLWMTVILVIPSGIMVIVVGVVRLRPYIVSSAYTETRCITTKGRTFWTEECSCGNATRTTTLKHKTPCLGTFSCAQISVSYRLPNGQLQNTKLFETEWEIKWNKKVSVLYTDSFFSEICNCLHSSQPLIS